MVAYIPAPALCQGADEDLIIEMGAVIFPGFAERNPAANGLRLKLDGDYKDESLRKVAADQFQILLGVLRAWRPIAGQREDERYPGIGRGSIRDEHGNQLVMAGSAIMYNVFGSEVGIYAREVKAALAYSSHLRNALWLNGRRDRNAADLYMVYEYAEDDLGGPKAIVGALGISDKEVTKLRRSANNLAPLEGGRHAKRYGVAEWGLGKQAEFVGYFLKKWITYRACRAGSR